jgi:hypothetical protein
MNCESFESTRAFPISKDLLDTANSVFWFLMDAMWMLGFTSLAKFSIIPTIATGLMLLYIEKRSTVFWINLAINCWILMNTLWMLEHIAAARFTFAVGMACVGVAVYKGDSLRETFSHFRRFRVLPIRQ